MNILNVEILLGNNAGKSALLSRLKLKTNVSLGFLFVLRQQLSVRLSFAITINKSQGHTVLNVRIYPPRYDFSHGQLYVALSREVSQNSTEVLIKEYKKMKTLQKKNIIFKDILLTQS
jgi:ATP-dependent DNA helicase PIF1